MRNIVYICDQCKKEIGNEKHISVTFAGHMASGIAIPPSKTKSMWSVSNKVCGRVMQFCNGQCIGKFFSELLKKP